MAKRKLEEFQKQLDELVIQERHLSNAIEQADAEVRYYTAAVANGTATQQQLNKANARLANAKEKQERFEATRDVKQQQIKDDAQAAGYNPAKLKENRGYDTIMKDGAGGSGGFKSALMGKGGGSIGAGIANLIGDAIGLASDIYIAEQKRSLSTWKQNQDIYLNAIETSGKIFQRSMNTFAKGMQGALNSSFASITQGVQEGAYAAAQNSINVGTELIKNQLDTQMDLMKQENYANIRTMEGELERLELRNQEIMGGASMVSGIAGMFGPWGQAIGGLVKGIAGVTTKIMESTSQIDIEKAKEERDIAEKQAEMLNDAMKSAVDSASEATKAVLEFAKSIENASLKTDAAAKSMGNMIGMSGGSIEGYEKFIFNATRNMYYTNSQGERTYLDKTAEDMAKMQAAYIDSSERNITMSRNDFIKTALLGKELGGDDNLAASLLGDMNYFNQTIENSTDMIHDMFIQANKAGVSNRKFAKDLQQNLKLAQKYTFKGGVEGLMKMSIWAQKTRFNMQSLETIVDKILDGGIEGVIKSSAQLQVLGGDFAINSDPLGMMYDAMADPEALGKRYNKMLEGMGSFNKKTGQVEINGPDVLRLKAYAQATGISYEDAVNQVKQGGKNAQIDSYLKKTGSDKNYTEEQKALIYNKAQYNTKTSTWQVTDNEGNMIGDISSLSNDQIKELMPVEERIEDHVSKIASWVEKQQGVTNYAQAVMSDETFENLKKNINDRMTENLNFINDSSAKLKSMVEKSNDFVTTQNKQQHALLLATTGILEDQFNIVEKSTEKLANEFLQSGGKLKDALDAVKDQLDYELEVIKHGEDSEEAKKAAEKAGRSKDKLSHTMKIKPEGASSVQYKNAMTALARNLSSSELNERIELYDKYKKRDGRLDEIGAAKADKGYNEVLDLGRGKKEILNILKDEGIISNTDTKNLTTAELKKVYEAMEYLVKNQEELLKETKKTSATSGSVTIISPTTGVRVSVPKTSNDGVVMGGGKSMYTQASEVTPINDGAVKMAKFHPMDTGVFAKPGGPWHELIHNVFGQVSETNDFIHNIGSTAHLHNPHYDMRGSGSTKNITNNAVDRFSNIVNTLEKIAYPENSYNYSSFRNGGQQASNEISSLVDNTMSVINVLEKIAYPENNYAKNSEQQTLSTTSNYADKPTSVINTLEKIAYPEKGNVLNTISNIGATSIQNNKLGDLAFGDNLSVATYSKGNEGLEITRNYAINKSMGQDKTVLPGEIKNSTNTVERYDKRDSSISERILENETLIDRLETVLSQVTQQNSFSGKPMEIKLIGSIDLKSGNQTVDILGLMKNDPNFIRSFTELLSYQFSRNAEGGKSEMFPKRFTLG